MLLYSRATVQTISCMKYILLFIIIIIQSLLLLLGKLGEEGWMSLQISPIILTGSQPKLILYINIDLEDATLKPEAFIQEYCPKSSDYY